MSGATALGAPAPSAGATFSVAISYTPSPSDPFLVTFSATVVPGTPTAFHWSFGDGQFANGTTGAYASPVHRYGGPGTYNVSVVVYEGNATATQFLPLTLSASALVASFTVTAQSGPAPFLDTFVATVRGGSGTYPSVLWQFGDGGVGSGLVIRYTFERAGDYVVVLNVTDSAGQSTVARAPVNVTAAPAGPTPLDSSGTLTLLAVAAAAIGGTIVGAVIVGRWLGRRDPRERLERSPQAAPEGAAASAEAEPISVPPAEVMPPSAPESFAEPHTTPSPVVETPAASLSVPRAPEGPAPQPDVEPAPPAGPAPEALRVSQRIVLHLAGLGVLGPDEVAAVGFTQLGMSQALGTRQNALTNVLRRLVAAGVLTEDVRHVRGQPRRLKVYRLTSRGEALAKELRHARARGSR